MLSHMCKNLMRQVLLDLNGRLEQTINELALFEVGGFTRG